MRQNKFTSKPYPIDLHGVRHEYVTEILEKTLLGYHNTDGYEIITGNSAPYDTDSRDVVKEA